MKLYELSMLVIIFGFSVLFILIILRLKKYYDFIRKGWRSDYDKSNINH
jgi:hypothetical protein